MNKNEQFEKVLNLLRNCKMKGLSEIVVDTPDDFDICEFESYVNKIDKNLIYSSKRSFDESNPGFRFKLYKTEEAFLDELCQHLAYQYASSNQKFYLPFVPEYLKPYDIKEWNKYISSKINVIKDMYIDYNGNFVISLLDNQKQIEEKARQEERENIERNNAEAFKRKICNGVSNAISIRKHSITFTNISDNNYTNLMIPDIETMVLINKQSVNHISSKNVFTFAMKLCDNEIDNAFERFEDEELKYIANKAVGLHAYLDSEREIMDPSICIYKAYVVTDIDRKTKDNKPYKFVKAYAYIIKSDSNKEIINDIENGKYDISLTVLYDYADCSICNTLDKCIKHKLGEVYDGKIAYMHLKAIKKVLGFNFVDKVKGDRIIPNDTDNVINIGEHNLKSVLDIVYYEFMEYIDGFSYDAENEMLTINLKEGS